MIRLLGKSARAKANQSHNKHPHYMGAKSYAQKGIEWRNEGRFPFTFDESNTSTPVSIHDRSWGWILGRQKKNDKGEWEIPKQETQEVVKRMEKVREDVVEGKFIPNRQDDVLSRGLKRVDRPGHVAGIGGTFGHRAYFGRPEYNQKASSSTSIDLDSFSQNLERKLEDWVRDILQSMGVKPPSGMDIQRGSNPESEPSIRDDPFDNLQEPTPCHLTLHSETSKKFEVVAIGLVMPTSSTVTHCMPHNSDDVRVTVDKVNSEYWMSPLPVRSPEFNHLGEAEGSFVRWPKSLVIIQKDGNTSKKKLVDENGMDRNRKGKEPENSQDATPTTMATPFCESDSYDFSDVCSKLVKIFAEDGILKILLDKDVFGFEQSKTTYVSKEDVTNLLTDGWLNETILSVWIMSLKKRCLEKEVHTISFLCPEDISAATINESHGNKKNAEDYMKDVMKASEDTKNFILGPYHQNNHWMLLAICPALSRVYVFDPMKMKRTLTIRNTLVMSFNLYKICGGSKLGSTLKWSAMTCAQQPQASESGYYVMRYMLDIIDNYSSCKSLFLEYERDGPFKKAEIDEVKDLWAAYVLDHVK